MRLQFQKQAYRSAAMHTRNRIATVRLIHGVFGRMNVTIGAGSGGGKPTKVQSIIEDELTKCQFDGDVRIVRYSKTPTFGSSRNS